MDLKKGFLANINLNLLKTQNFVFGPTPSAKETLLRAIDDAQRLIAHASLRGISIKKEDILSIVALKEHDTQPISAEQEAAFWSASSSIASLSLPTSVNTLNSSLARTVTGENLSYYDARKYRYRTISTFIFLLLFQIYWLIGATIISDLKEARPRLEALQTEMYEGEKQQATLDIAAPDYSEKKKAADSTLERFTNKLWIERITASTEFKILKTWNLAESFLISKSTKDNTQDVSRLNPDDSYFYIKPSDHFLWVYNQDNVEQIETSEIVLTSIIKYVLPLLYGALGASAYIVRTVSSEMKSDSYSIDSRVRYQLRYYLGAVAGFSIAWFTSDPKVSGTDSLLPSLSPLALAFLAGYSVELLFSLLDRFVSAFSGPEPRKPI